MYTNENLNILFAQSFISILREPNKLNPNQNKPKTSETKVRPKLSGKNKKLENTNKIK